MWIPMLNVRDVLTGKWHSMAITVLKPTADDFRAWNLDINCPIGKLWWSKDPTNPGDIVGGTWKPVQDKFIIASGPKHPAGSTGGAEEIVLTVEQMPKHSHKAVVNPDSSGAYGYILDNHAEQAEMSANAAPVSSLIDYAGESQPVNIMNPYEAYYCWERVK